MSENHGFTPGMWYCESDGIYNATRSYMITPTGDSDEDRANAALIVELHNSWWHGMIDDDR